MYEIRIRVGDPKGLYVRSVRGDAGNDYTTESFAGDVASVLVGVHDYLEGSGGLEALGAELFLSLISVDSKHEALVDARQLVKKWQCG